MYIVLTCEEKNKANAFPDPCISVIYLMELSGPVITVQGL